MTPPISVSRSACASRSNASSRVSPAAISFAIIGSYAVPISSPFAHAGVDADPVGQPQPLEPAGLGQERARVLRVQPHLHRVPPQVTVCYKVGQGLSGRDAQLLAHDVDARHELRHGMLDLDPRVELEEPEVAAVEHELGGSRALVADRAREGDRRVAHPRAQLGIERGGGRLLEHLLVAPLDRAVALAECDDVAVLVGEQLDLDVARPLEEALAEDGVVAERRGRLAPRRRERLVELLRRAHDAHAAPAAARRRLHEQREADLLRRPARQDGDAGRARRLLRGELVAAGSQRRRRRPDPRQSRAEHRLGELGALGEEAVAGMDGVGAGFSRGANVLGRRRDMRRSRRARRRRRHAASRGRRAPRPRPSRCPRRGRRGRSAARSLPGLRRAGGACGRV